MKIKNNKKQNQKSQMNQNKLNNQEKANNTKKANKKNEQKQTLKHIFKNDWFLLKHMFLASPLKYFMNLGEHLFNRLFDVVYDVLLLKKIFEIIEQKGDITELVPWFIGIILLTIIRKVYSGQYWWYICHKEDQKIMQYLNKMIYKKCCLMDLECYEDPEFYNKYVIAAKEIYTRGDAFITSFNMLLGCSASIGAILTILASLDFTFLPFAILPAFIAIPISFYCQRINARQQKETEPVNRRGDYLRRVVYLSQYAKEIRLTNIFDVLSKRYDESGKEILGLTTKYGLQWGVVNLMYNFIFWVPSAFVLPLLIAQKVSLGVGLSMSGFIPTLNGTKSLTWQINAFVDGILSFREHSIMMDNIMGFFEHAPIIKQNENGLDVPSTNITIELRNVVYTYHGQENPTIKGISMIIHPKEKIALVGVNGAGKTTLIKLIMQLYKPTSGEILLNGINISEYKLREYYDMIGTVFQDYQMYALSVGENVLLREVKTKEDEKTVIDSLKLAGVYDKICTLKEGIKTPLTHELSPDGVVLSGGENQKIAISRVFANGSELVILDEPSSALDPIAEHEVYQSIKKAAQNRGIIFISHRLSSTKMSDKIYLLDDGKILEQGNHNELMDLNGKYAEMFNKQAESYIKGKDSSVIQEVENNV